jgi:TatD DNase family protein
LRTPCKVVAIGETGLDYYRLKGDLEWQRERFRIHIRAARRRQTADHPYAGGRRRHLRILAKRKAPRAEGYSIALPKQESRQVGAGPGLPHFALRHSYLQKRYQIKEVASFVPLDRLLVETDAPYLAPVPYRGKQNHPALVLHVAEEVAKLRGIDLWSNCTATTDNFFRLFGAANRA